MYGFVSTFTQTSKVVTPLMIAEFQIENFFSIKSEQKISFVASPDSFMSDEYLCEMKDGSRLLKIGIVYGANASGKTNLLNAIEFFRMVVLRMPQDRKEKTGVIPFMLDDESRKKNTRMSMTFYVNQSKYILRIELNEKCICSEELVVYDTYRPTKLYSRNYDEHSDSTKIEFGTKLKLTKKSREAILGNTINNSSVLAAFGKSNAERTRLNDVYEYFANQVKDALSPAMSLSSYVKSKLNNDDTGDLKKFILGVLRASDFNIDDVSLQEKEELITPELEQLIKNAPIQEEAKAEMLRKGKITNTQLAFRHRAGDKTYDLSEQFESKGTIRFLGLSVILNHLLKTDSCVLIDEVETSIHYELLSYFIKLFLANSDGTSQLLLTTHDINLLDEDFIRRDTVWFTDKNEMGETKVWRLSSLGLHKNLSPYNAYKQGKLVKLPFLGSPYINLN